MPGTDEPVTAGCGGTGWHLDGVDLDLEGDLFLPVAEVNRMRRELLAQLDRLADGSDQSSAVAVDAVAADPAAVVQRLLPSPQRSAASPALTVLVRSLEQLQALAAQDDLPIHAVVADLELLTTLPRREALSGLAEVIKAAILADEGLLNCSKPKGRRSSKTPWRWQKPSAVRWWSRPKWWHATNGKAVRVRC